MPDPAVSLIVPTLNEEDRIEEHLRYHRDHFDGGEFVVVDGGSRDRTVECVRALPFPVRLVQCSPGGRAAQLHEGCRISRGEYLLMLHADTRLPPDFTLEEIPACGRRWGWFDCRLDEEGPIYRGIGWSISQRSALFSNPTGDQAIWVRRGLLDAVGGIPRQPLMEDVELVWRLRQRGTGRRFTRPVRTSARRWKREGVIRTVLTMWILRLAYGAGMDPDRLRHVYYGSGSPLALLPRMLRTLLAPRGA